MIYIVLCIIVRYIYCNVVIDNFVEHYQASSFFYTGGGGGHFQIGRWRGRDAVGAGGENLTLSQTARRTKKYTLSENTLLKTFIIFTHIYPACERGREFRDQALIQGSLVPCTDRRTLYSAVYHHTFIKKYVASRTHVAGAEIAGLT